MKSKGKYLITPKEAFQVGQSEQPTDASPGYDDKRSSVEYELDESGGVANVNSFEDLQGFIGTFGRWNIWMFFLCYLCTLMAPFQIITYEFVGATPDYWCRVDTLIEANWTQEQIINLAIPAKNGTGHEGCQMYKYNYSMAVDLGYETVLDNRDLISEGGNSEIMSCTSRDFNYSQYESTLVTEWDLVCERRVLYSTTQAVAQGGILFGAVVTGYLSDVFGRRRIILLSIALTLLTGLGAAAAPEFEIYVLLKFLASGLLMGFYSGVFIFMIELCSASQRSSVASLFLLPWALGYMIVPGMAYLIRSWRWLQAAYTVPVAFLLSYYWLLPESPRWLVTKGRREEALKILTWAAKVNNRTLPPSDALLISMKKMTKKEEQINESFFRVIYTKIRQLVVLVITPEFRGRACICYFCWFSCSMVYYGIALNSGNLSTDPYLYMFLGGLVEVPSYVLLWPSLAYLGRKVSVISQFLACAVSISAIAILMVTMDEVSTGLMMFLSLSGKLVITATFHLLFVYTAELFPTDIRSFAVGQCNMMARVGSMTSPYINDLLGDFISWSPSALFAAVSILSAALAFLLPETKGAHLNEDKTFDEKEAGKEEEA